MSDDGTEGDPDGAWDNAVVAWIVDDDGRAAPVSVYPENKATWGMPDARQAIRLIAPPDHPHRGDNRA